MTPPRRRALAATAAGLALAGTGSLLLLQGATFASAETSEPSAVADVSLAWGLSGEQGGGAFFGGCNFLSAGTAGDTGSSRVWTESDGFYATSAGTVTVEKPNASGVYVAPTWATKCQAPDGSPVSAGSTSSLTGNRVVFGGGTGSVDVAAGTATVAWTGSFTSAFYGGLTYWSAADPVLTVAGGTGTLTATLSGYGSDMDDPTQWETIAPRSVTLATLSAITLSANGFSLTPDYLGVAVTTPDGATPQTQSTADNAASWGAFPQDFVDFQQLTGQSSYWFASGGSRDAAKPATPLAVAWELPDAPPSSTPPSTPTSSPTATVTDSPSATDPPTGSNSPTTTTTPAASCIPTDTVTDGALTWGVKKSFRGYVAGATGTSISTAGGATILGSDLAVAGRADSGTIRWPFASSTSYASADTFTVAYAGSVTFSYPAHYFTIVIASPRLEIVDGSGVLVADITSTISAPGSAPSTEQRDDVSLATVTFAGSDEDATSGVSLVAHTAVEDTAAFSFNGSSFYQRGQALDDAAIVLANCDVADPIANATTSSSAAAAAPLDLVPTLQFRPTSLPTTGASVSTPVVLGAVLVLLGATVTFGATLRRPLRGRR